VATRRYGRRTVETSREEKVLFPEPGLTKGDVIDYYERVADRILPHLKDRPLVLQRFPDGIGEAGFYQKQIGDHFPDWIHRTRVEVGSGNGHQELVVCDQKATLVYLANQGCITLHPWLSRMDRIDHPDSLIVDLDPPGNDFDAARRAALQVRALFDELDLPTWVKLTGSKGVHVLTPLDRSSDFDAVRAFARDAMALLAARHPDALTTEQRKSKRRGRVYLDVGRNAYGQTAVAPWSLRPRPEAPVAAPVAWSALERADVGPRDYTLENVFRRTGSRRDPWAGMRRRARSSAHASVSSGCGRPPGSAASGPALRVAGNAVASALRAPLLAGGAFAARLAGARPVPVGELVPEEHGERAGGHRGHQRLADGARGELRAQVEAGEEGGAGDAHAEQRQRTDHPLRASPHAHRGREPDHGLEPVAGEERGRPVRQVRHHCDGPAVDHEEQQEDGQEDLPERTVHVPPGRDAEGTFRGRWGRDGPAATRAPVRC